MSGEIIPVLSVSAILSPFLEVLSIDTWDSFTKSQSPSTSSTSAQFVNRLLRMKPIWSGIWRSTITKSTPVRFASIGLLIGEVCDTTSMSILVLKSFNVHSARKSTPKLPTWENTSRGRTKDCERNAHYALMWARNITFKIISCTSIKFWGRLGIARRKFSS